MELVPQHRAECRGDVTVDCDHKRPALGRDCDSVRERADARVLRLAVPFHRDGDRSRPANVATEPHHRYVAQRKRSADADGAARDLHGELRRADHRRADPVARDLERRRQRRPDCEERSSQLAAEVVVVPLLATGGVLGDAARQGDAGGRCRPRQRRKELKPGRDRRAARSRDDRSGELACDPPPFIWIATRVM